MKDFKVTKEGGLRGTELLNELSTATGLPNEMIGEELSRLISTAGKSTDNVTLDELREMLAAYLQDILLEAKDSFAGDARSEIESAAASIELATDLQVTGSSSKIVSLATATSVQPASHASSTPTFAMFSTLGSSAPDFIGEG
jgi:hypothetical protein